MVNAHDAGLRLDVHELAVARMTSSMRSRSTCSHALQSERHPPSAPPSIHFDAGKRHPNLCRVSAPRRETSSSRSLMTCASVALRSTAPFRKVATVAKPGQVPDISTIRPFSTPKPADCSAVLNWPEVIFGLDLKKRMMYVRRQKAKKRCVRPFKTGVARFP